MAPITRADDSAALEHILVSILLEPLLPTTSGSTTPPFRACFAKAGITNASDFLSISPSEYGLIDFTTDPFEEADQNLSLTQVKKINSLFSWFHQIPFSDATRWLSLDYQSFQVWRSQPTPTPQGATSPAAISLPSSAIHDFRKSVKRSVSDYNIFKEDRLWHSWHRHLLTTARSHNVDQVLDLSYAPSDPDDIALLKEQQRFVFSVLEQKVLTSDGIVFIRVHSASGDATAVYSNLVERYSKSTAAQLSASEIEEDLSTFRLDSTWTKTNLMFLNTWATRILDLDLVLIQPTTESQKRIWFTRAISPKLILSMSISQFEASEKLTGLAFGSTYQKAPFSTLFDHVKDDAIRLDQTERLLQTATRKANEAKTKLQEGSRPTLPSPGRTPGPSGTPSASKTFVGRDGKDHNYLIPPDIFKTMTQAERFAELKRLKAAKGYQANEHSASTVVSNNTSPTGTPTSAAPGTPASMTISYRDAAQSGATPSVFSTQSGYPVNNPVPPPTGLHSTSGGGTNNLIRQILSSNQSVPPAVSSGTQHTQDSFINIDGHIYRQVNSHTVQYDLSRHESSTPLSSLIDGGANGGMTGSDVRVISSSDFHRAHVTGIGDSTITDLPLVTAAAFVHTHRGPAVVFMHQYAHYGKGHTIHSSAQIRAFGTDVHDTPRSQGGQQRLITSEGYHIPLSYRSGLPYMDMRPPTDEELKQLPHIILTSDAVWDPACLDDEFSPDEIAQDAPSLDLDPRVTATGEYTGNLQDDIDLILAECRQNSADCCETRSVSHTVTTAQPDLELLRPFFGWMPIDRIKKTIAATTQFARASVRLPMRKHYKSRFPAYNVHRWNEAVATDTFFCDTPAHDDGILGHAGATMAQLYVGKNSTKTHVYPMRLESDMSKTLEDLIRTQGAPNSLFSDNAKAQCGKRVLDILRLYGIKDFQSEPHHQHQNYAERKIGDTKRLTDAIMDRTGTQAHFWLLCLLYVVFLLNHLASDALGGLTPLEVATGQRPDISALLQFRWFEPVLYSVDHKFASDSPEKSGRWVGIAEHQGDALTYLILTDDTNKVIARSAVRSALDPGNPNFRARPNPGFKGPNSDGTHSSPTFSPTSGDGESSHTPILFSASDLSGLDIDSPELKLPHFSPDELLGLTFIRDMDDGSKYRAKVARKIVDNDAANHQKIKFLVEMSDGKLEEIIAYNELSDVIETQHEAELHSPDSASWAFKEITEHQGPLNPSDKKYKGSSYNVLVHWEDGSETFEPLSVMAKADPVTCAKYAQDNDLLERPGWKSLKRIATRTVKFARMCRQAKLHTERRGPTYKFGILLPNDRNHALRIDKDNDNHVWETSIGVEMAQIAEYNTFRNMGRGAKPPRDHQRIRVHFVFDVKHDLRCKSRLVAGGHMTAPPKDSVYSGVVTLRSLRLCMFLGELNGLNVDAADVGNAYLMAYTKEKLYIIAGPEFGDIQGSLLVIVKALYGLRTSGARWHEFFADTLMDMGFYPCKADPDVWMRDCGTHYEFVCVYVDDLACVMSYPNLFFEELRNRGYKLKGVGEITYHLGGDFYRDPDGTLAWGAKTYIKRVVNQCQSIFGHLPKEYTSPIDKDDHPELDTSEELPAEGIQHYQSLIGSFQWAVSLGRYDIQCATMTLGKFRSAPRQGHLDRLQRVCGYLRKYPDAAIRFRTGIPDYSHLEHVTFDWAYSVYGDSNEELPWDMPTPRGNLVRTTTFEDANLMHDLTTGRSCTGILHLVNQTPVEWFSKRQKTVETATYGSEFVAARIATEQIMDLRYTLRMMGVPLDGKAYMFGDNQSVITSGTIPHSSLNKRHNALAYHRVREAIASDVIWFFHISGTINPADVLTKFLGHAGFWPLIKPFLFWRGEPSQVKTLFHFWKGQPALIHSS